jgi:hypothetical protein
MPHTKKEVMQDLLLWFLIEVSARCQLVIDATIFVQAALRRSAVVEALDVGGRLVFSAHAGVETRTSDYGIATIDHRIERLLNTWPRRIAACSNAVCLLPQ